MSNYAANTLVYYFRRLWDESQLYWNEDNEAEVRSIIESVVPDIDRAIEQKSRAELRLKIATEILASLLAADATIWVADADATSTDLERVNRAISLADLLLARLAK